MKARDIPYVVTRMSVHDIAQVAAIEKATFTKPWSARSFRHELTRNETAHYFVVYHRESKYEEPEPTSWWDRLRRQFRGPRASRFVLGYGGFWTILDEAHISTIAVRPKYRHCGLGKLLMITMLKHAIALEAQRMTLEVRESNRVAQQLYRQHGFQVTGRRRRYYSDNREDALIMTVEAIHTPAYRRRLADLEQALYRELVSQLTPPVPLPTGRQPGYRRPRPES